MQVLNSNKFKLPFRQEELIKYLDKDGAFLFTMMKQKYFPEELVIEELKIPFNEVLEDLASPSSKLMNIFEDATLKNDK